ncbi:hypothetical protein H4R24_001449 [Coemansia sp. RSA 988]|nr:hypothetical protein H4R24_001449 [Coemansia sp. RSA 988]
MAPSINGDGRRNATNRESMGLGIVLSNNTPEIDFQRMAESMGLETRQISNHAIAGYTGSQTPRIRTSGRVVPKPVKPASTLFTRLFNGISSFMSTVDDSERSHAQQPKSQIEDMLEAYYISQNREVPSWVYSPPPDPPINIENQPVNVTASPIDDSTSVSVEQSREVSAKPSSTSTNSVLRSFAKLNISKLTRPQHSRDLLGQLANAGESQYVQQNTNMSRPDTPVASRSSQQPCRARPQQLSKRSGHESKSNTPLSSQHSHRRQSPVNVQLVDSGNEMSSSGEDTPIPLEDHTLPESVLESTHLVSIDDERATPASAYHWFARHTPRRALDMGRVLSRDRSRSRPSTPASSISRENSSSQRTPAIKPRPKGPNQSPMLTPPLPPWPDYISSDGSSRENTSALLKAREKPQGSTTEIPESRKRGLSASLPGWANPSKWRFGASANKQPSDSADKSTSTGLGQHTAAKASTSDNDTAELRNAQSATPRSNKVMRLFKRHSARP